MSIKQIAAEAGLSKATVSMILNKKESPLTFSKDTKKRVWEIAKRLDYHPNYQARSLSTGKTECIGVAGGALWAMDNISLSQTYSGIGRAVHDRNYNMMFFPIGQGDAEAVMIKAVRSRMVDGLAIIVFSSMHEDFLNQTLPSLKEAKIPVVAIHSTNYNYPCHNVGFDSVKAGYLAAQHLLDQGIRTIGFTGIRGKGRLFNDLMYNGYRKAMEEAGYPETDLRLDSPYYQDNALQGYEYGKKLVAGNVPEGLVVHADTFAYGIMDALKEKGISVPEDTAMVSIDNVLKEDIRSSDLTTVDRKFEERGRLAGEMLFRAIDNGKNSTFETQICEPELIVRKSSIKPIDS